jgi:hypothetical protein
VAWLLVASSLQAEVPELVTDRPDQTESASVVPAGYWQIEIGSSFEHDDEQGTEVEELALASTLLRLGLHERAELRIGWTGFQRMTEDAAGAGAQRIDGVGDMELGAKFLLAEATEQRPQLAMIVASSVPTGSDDVSSHHFEPSFRFNLDLGLGRGVAFGANLGAEWESVPGAQDGGTAIRWIYTVVLGFDLGDRWGAFVEAFGSQRLDGPDVPGESSLDGGVTWSLRQNLQLDLAAGVGLADASADWTVGIGLSFRWPR